MSKSLEESPEDAKGGGGGGGGFSVRAVVNVISLKGGVCSGLWPRMHVCLCVLSVCTARS